jgi:hypothetical protein
MRGRRLAPRSETDARRQQVRNGADSPRKRHPQGMDRRAECTARPCGIACPPRKVQRNARGIVASTPTLRVPGTSMLSMNEIANAPIRPTQPGASAYLRSRPGVRTRPWDYPRGGKCIHGSHVGRTRSKARQRRQPAHSDASTEARVARMLSDSKTAASRTPAQFGRRRRAANSKALRLVARPGPWPRAPSHTPSNRDTIPCASARREQQVSWAFPLREPAGRMCGNGFRSAHRSP